MRPYSHCVTSRASTWLPDHQLAVAATLSHADELIGQLSDMLFAYQTRADGIVELEEQLAFPRTRTVVTRIVPMPRKIPLLVADALVTLRAALEHALYVEITHREGPLGDKAARLVEIPACRTLDDFRGWVGGRAKNGAAALRAGGELVRRIEGLQPFNRKDAENHPLARLVLHTNHAKHRNPAVTAVRIAAMYDEDRLPRSIRDLPARAEEPVRVGDVLAETPVGTQMVVALFPTIGINRPGTDRWPVLMTELDEISRWVRDQAVPRLITGGEPPNPGLPARYDITVGHNDERAAIATGSFFSAAERHQERLGAASARNDLADLIDRMDDSPGAERISAWLAALTDRSVLDRASRLTATHSYDQNIVRRNLRVLEEIRVEAAAFMATSAD